MERNKYKIVYLLPGGLFNSGGMERVTTIKANYLADELGYDVFIVTTEQLGRPVFYPLSDRVRLYHLDLGIHAHFGNENYLKKCISRYGKIREYKKTLEKLLSEIRPDFIISTLGLDMEFLSDLKDGSIQLGELHFPGNFRQLMARKLSNHAIPNFVAKLRTQNLRKKCGKLSRLIVLTEEEKASWTAFNNVTVMPNPLPFFQEEIAPCQSKKAMAVGRLAYEKGFDQLILAWKKVFEKYPDWRLDIFGNGDQKEVLLDLISQNGLKSVVRIHDAVGTIDQQYMEHSIMLFPSRYLEALPMVLIESMSCGLPVVAFDAPCGPKDLVKDGRNGFLVPSGDIAMFSAKVNELIQSEELRRSMGKVSREFSLNFKVNTIMEQWIRLFEELKKEG